MRRGPLSALLAAGVAVGVAVSSLVVSHPSSASRAPSPAEGGEARLHLVALTGPGSAAADRLFPTGPARELARQQRLLERVGAPEPVYRWTTALSGVAVELTDTQVRALRADPDVALVEPDTVRPLAGLRAAATATVPGVPPAGRDTGGAGTVIGLVDSGLHPDGPVFSGSPGLGRAPRDFRGTCETAPDWDASACTDKVLAARWYLEGFGRDRLRAASSLSPRDDHGHGTRSASVAAGNSHVTVRVGDEDLGTHSGAAPQARLAIYKACWTAPDPADDGCASSDLVTAIDQATADRVDVLSVAVGGAPGPDVVELALLGAAEADIVVVAAAGNGGSRSWAAHPSPWVTTVGGTAGVQRRGRVALGDGGPVLGGAMASRRPVGPAPLVRAADVPAPGVPRDRARQCAPGSLDAAQVRGAIVVCDRGLVGRVDKSAAVELADGAGMVLLNTGRGSVDADLHSVPTVHLAQRDAERLRTWVRGHRGALVTLRPDGHRQPRAKVAGFSPGGDPAAAFLKPDLLAPATGVLSAVPPRTRAERWDFASGTSVATAHTAGVAARLRARRDWSAAAVRSALATTSTPVSGSVLRTGAGRLRPELTSRPGLVHDVDPRDYRRWLEGSLGRELNTPSVLLHEGRDVARRTITNVGRQALYFSSSASGFEHYDVRVTPAAVRLAPGESATYTVRVSGPAGARPADDGVVTWRGATGTRTRVPVLITR
ncbi:S8 family serine peptidase [Nocardioides sp. zg-DK7169]|uniref:S8 family serine peptidase n=1 Tax=Nocardioides sp. zg-DK7169 TaxID=2736600 RepID=UPI001555C8F6|nr:S8 family serine peptidase [Nocardioides sp. zg-DK7169]